MVKSEAHVRLVDTTNNASCDNSLECDIREDGTVLIHTSCNLGDQHVQATKAEEVSFAKRLLYLCEVPS